MSLFIRVQTSFWTHRKTMRLRARIGDSAFWLPPRLWSYAAENQPDGNFADYSAQELAMLLGYSEDAQAMLQALQELGFMDGMEIHDWNEHNAYHQTFADRAKKAAEARWRGQDKTRQDKKGDKQCLNSTQAMLQASDQSISKARGTIQDLRSFCVEIGLLASDGDSCFYKWEGNGWKNGTAAIKDWRMTIRSWKSAGYLPSQRNEKPKPKASVR